jgi:hypothetical protein
MKPLLHSRRTLALLAAVLSSTLLSACVAVPVGGPGVRGNVVVDVTPAYYYQPAPSGYYYRPYYTPHRRRW